MKMRMAIVDPYSKDKPLFERVRAKGELPSITYRLAGYDFGKFGGIPVIHKGYATVTHKYRIDLLCDVCDRPVHYDKAHYGLSIEVPRTEAEKMVAAEKKVKKAVAAGKELDIPPLDRELVKNFAKEVNLFKYFKFQCGKCGRWVGKGREHASCEDEEWGLCKYCGKIMKKLVGEIE